MCRQMNKLIAPGTNSMAASVFSLLTCSIKSRRVILSRLLLIIFSLAIFQAGFAAEEDPPYLYILGVAQDAGFPQSGCYVRHCMAGWEDPTLKRGATSVALIDPSARRKFIFEATPNFPDQLYRLEVEASDSRFDLSGIFLTHAHIGHYSGLMFLGQEAMGASSVPVYAMPRMEAFLRNNGPWSQLATFQNIELRSLNNGKSEVFNDLIISPFLVPHRDEFSETVGYRIQGPNKSAIFIPDINKWDDWDQSIVELIRTVDYALIDATFFADGELPGRDMSQIPHPFVSESLGIFQEFSEAERNKVWFIHMNHTNPLLNSDSDESKRINSEGYNIATEGVRLRL